MKNDDFVEATANVRVLEKKILTRDSVERIIDAPTSGDALKMISQNSEYDFTQLKPEEDYEVVIGKRMRAVYELAYKLAAGNPIVVDIAAAKYCFHNMKAALKFKYAPNSAKVKVEDRADDGTYSEIGRMGLDTREIEHYLAGKGGDAESKLPDWAKAALDGAETAYLEHNDPQAIDIFLDRALFGRMLETALKTENEYIIRYIRLSIDFYNIKTFLRVKGMRKGSRFLGECLAEGGLTDKNVFLQNYDKQPDALVSRFYYQYFGDEVKEGIEHFNKSGNFGLLERLLDNMLMEHIKQSKYVAFGPEVLFSYVICKENEARQIRILATGKINGMPVQPLRERLRDNYA